RLGRLLILVLLGVGLLGASVLWVLQTKARPLVHAVTDSGAWPSWLTQTPAYTAPETATAPPPAPVVEQTAVELAKLRALVQQQQHDLEELKRRGMVKPVAPTPAPAAPPRREPPPMWYVSHEVKDAAASATGTTYTLAPGATKLPCVIETAINS